MKIKSLASKKVFTLSTVLAILVLVAFYSINAGNGAENPKEVCAVRAIKLLPPESAKQKPVVIRAEVAVTDTQRQTGLMYRKSMAQDTGMIFYWDEPQQIYMWMKNTFIPLDMIYINGAEVVGVIEATKTQNTTPLTIPALADSVLEVNHGVASQHGISRGWRVKKGACIN